VVLVPILMGLLGRANWWFPARFRAQERNAPKTILPTVVGS